MSLDNDPHDPAMPYISVTNPTSVYEVLAPQIVTTTIYPSSTASATSTHPHRQVVPIGAIVGGVCAGAAAAVVVDIASLVSVLGGSAGVAASSPKGFAESAET